VSEKQVVKASYVATTFRFIKQEGGK
jgi:hypothetical protein